MLLDIVEIRLLNKSLLVMVTQKIHQIYSEKIYSPICS